MTLPLPPVPSTILRVFGLTLLLLVWGATRLEATGTDEPVLLRADGLPTVTSTAALANAQRAVLRAFLRDHPNYRIEPFMMPGIQGQEMDTRPLMGIASGNPPHAIYVNFRQSSSYINHGFLEPLEVLLARVLAADERQRQADADGRWLADPDSAQIEAALQAILDRPGRRSGRDTCQKAHGPGALRRSM